jgi:hypothetical protein
MVRNKRYIKTYSALLPLESFLEQYCSKTIQSWFDIQKYVNDAFNIQTHGDYEAFLKAFYVSRFDYEKMKEFYKKIKIDLSFFDDDILRYIAFIEGLGYFEKIGNPSLDVWLNAVDFNRPFKQYGEYDGFSIMEVVYLKYGGNAIRNQLLSALRYVTSW